MALTSLVMVCVSSSYHPDWSCSPKRGRKLTMDGGKQVQMFKLNKTAMGKPNSVVLHLGLCRGRMAFPHLLPEFWVSLEVMDNMKESSTSWAPQPKQARALYSSDRRNDPFFLKVQGVCYASLFCVLSRLVFKYRYFHSVHRN